MKETRHVNGEIKIHNGVYLSRFATSAMKDISFLADLTNGKILKYGDTERDAEYLRKKLEEIEKTDDKPRKLRIYNTKTIWGNLSSDGICTLSNYLLSGVGEKEMNRVLTLDEKEVEAEVKRLVELEL